MQPTAVLFRAAASDAARQILDIAFGMIFLVSAAGKWLGVQRFESAVAGYRLIPGAVVPLVAAGIMMLETVVGLGLACGMFVRAATLSGSLLFVLFALAIGINLLRGRSFIDCGCSVASRGQQLEWRLVVSNLVCAAVLMDISPAARSIDWVAVIPPALGLCLTYYVVSSVWPSASFRDIP